MMKKKLNLAIVIPVYGNELSLRQLYDRINIATSSLPCSISIIFVNDRSFDNSQEVIEALTLKDSRVRGVLLSKNHGSFVAIVAGLNEATDSDAVIILSADLQDPPEKIPELVEKWLEGFPVVLGVRRKRADSLDSLIFSKTYHWLFRKFVIKDMPTGGFDFCLIDQKVVKVVIQSSEKSTSLIGLIIWSGFDRALVQYDRAERIHGKSEWSVTKKMGYAVDSIISFSSIPLKFFVGLGITLSALSLLGIAYVLMTKILGVGAPSGWTSLALIILILASFQFLAFGVLGEYFWNNLEQTRKRPLFIVDRKVGGGDVDNDFLTDSAVPVFDLASVTADIRQSAAESAKRVIDSPQVILGPEVIKFEREFSSITGIKQTVGVASGSDAITLALMASDVRQGDLVVTSALSAPATAVAILRAGAKPLFVDVDEDSLLISVNAIEKVLSNEVKAIVPVHLYGNGCDMDNLTRLASSNNLPIVEDCAQSFGTTINGKSCGSFSKAAAFSFYPTKNLGAYGDAGAVVTEDSELAEKLRMMRFYGQNDRGEVVTSGFNSRLDEIQAALLRDRLKIIEKQNRRRVEIADLYDKELGFLNPVKRVSGSVPHLYVVRPPSREKFRSFLAEHKVNSGIHYPTALTRHKYLKENCATISCPIAEKACSTVVSLPLYPGITNRQVARVVEACQKWSKIDA